VEKKEKKLYKKWMPFSKLHTIGFWIGFCFTTAPSNDFSLGISIIVRDASKMNQSVITETWWKSLNFYSLEKLPCRSGTPDFDKKTIFKNKQCLTS
jgi:hypothetical protein